MVSDILIIKKWCYFHHIMMSFDVIIIGGGPAGAVCGIGLQKRGITTCIIDKAVFPRDKLCGGMITQKAIDLLKNICPDIHPNDYITHQTNTVDFHFKDTYWTTFKTQIPFAFTERKVFDHLLINQYKKYGGTLIENTRIKEKNIEFEGNTLATDNERFQFKVLVGADGCNGIITRCRNIKRHYSFCLEGKLSKKPAGNKDFRIYFGCVQKGYGWHFPKKDHCVVGIGSSNHNKSLQNKTHSFFKELIPGNVEMIKGALIPTGQLYKIQRLPGNVITIGDAAGFSDAVTGEGLYFALLSGFYASEEIALKINLNPFTINHSYVERSEALRRNIRFSYFYSRILYHPLILNIFLNHIKIHHAFALFYLEKVMLTDQANYTNFLVRYFFRIKCNSNKKSITPTHENTAKNNV